MDTYPILAFPKHAELQIGGRGGGPSSFHSPSVARQGSRLSPSFDRLQSAIDSRRAEIRADASGVSPEMVLVLETVGSVESFVNAVRRTPLEWLLEWEIEDIAPDEDFFDLKDSAKELSGQVYLVLTDHSALRQLESLWRRWLADPDASFERGLNRFRDVFRQLREIRPWGIEDRVHATGILADWADRMARSQSRVRFELELWFRDSTKKRGVAQSRIRDAVSEAGGRLLSSAIVPEIAYHAVLAEVPVEAVSSLLQDSGEHIRLFHCDEVMHVRPVGQCSTVPVEALDGQIDIVVPSVEPIGEPVAALLDGLPLSNHPALRGRVIVDDPDDFESGYPAAERRHGTAMASLILNRDLSGESDGISRPIYARPILRPDRSLPGGTPPELIPDDVLPIDIVHRSVRRIFEGDGAEPPAAPTIRIINLSVGDPSRLFDRGISAWARLLDWLAWKYDVLFIVSAGNHVRPLELPIPRGTLDQCTPEQVQDVVLRALDRDGRNRRILAPGESVNALTVGATHDDDSAVSTPDGLVDPFVDLGLPSPVNAIGLGYRRAIKPDVLAPGGRVAFRPKLGSSHDSEILVPAVGSASPPGQKVAAPGAREGQLNSHAYTCGSSNAAAFVTSVACSIYDRVVVPLVSDHERDGGALGRKHEAVVTKALLAHTSSWEPVRRAMTTLVDTDLSPVEARDRIARLVGFGPIRADRAVDCAAHRVTFVGWGSISRDSAHGFSMPLPDCLAGTTVLRRVAATLAWTAPVSPQNQKYRRVALWLDSDDSGNMQALLRVARSNAHWQTARRGSLQHELFEGESATDFDGKSAISIRVNCRSEIDSFREAVPYAIAITLEVEAVANLPIYEQVAQKVRPAVPVRS